MIDDKAKLIEYASSRKYRAICMRLTKDEQLASDLHQEFLLILLKYDKKKLSKIRQPNAFLFRILKNMAYSSTSEFYRTYRKGMDLETINQFKEACSPIHFSHKFIHALESLYWYEREILKLYIKHGHSTGISKELNIPIKSIRFSVAKAKKEIKKRMNQFPIKVLLPIQYNVTGLDYHRLLMPFERLQKTHGEIYDIKLIRGIRQDDKIYEPPLDSMTDEQLKGFNVIYFLRQVSYDINKIQPTIDRIKSLGLKIIFDIDDYWKLPKEHYWHTKYKEQKVEGGVMTTLKQADAVSTTTNTFANIIKEFNQNVTILPNCINPDEPQFKAVNISSPRIRFGWIGGVFHKTDLEILKPAIENLYKNAELNNKFQICLGGYNPNPEFKEMENILTANYHFKNYDKPYYNYLLQQTPAMEHIAFDKSYRRLWGKDVRHYGEIYNDVDICLVPLIKNIFNECKSELKIVEAGWMKKAVICSDVEPYNKWIQDGVNGFLIKPERNYIDWFVAMRKLILNPELIKQMGEALHKTITENFDIDIHNKRRDTLIKSVVFA